MDYLSPWDRVSRIQPKTGEHAQYFYTVVEIDTYKSDKAKAEQEATDDVLLRLVLNQILLKKKIYHLGGDKCTNSLM